MKNRILYHAMTHLVRQAIYSDVNRQPVIVSKLFPTCLFHTCLFHTCSSALRPVGSFTQVKLFYDSHSGGVVWIFFYSS